jgi:hypothetical protein
VQRVFFLQEEDPLILSYKRIFLTSTILSTDKGWGEGLKPLSACYQTNILRKNPLPNPPPHAGEGI